VGIGALLEKVSGVGIAFASAEGGWGARPPVQEMTHGGTHNGVSLAESPGECKQLRPLERP